MKSLKRIMVLAIAAVMLFTSAACGKKQVTVMEYEGIKVTNGMFSYGLSLNKSQVLYSITYGTMVDNPQYWQYNVGDGKTLGQAVMENYIENTKLCMAAYAELQKLGISASEANESSIEELYKGQLQVQGSLAKLNVYLADYGVDVEGMKEYYRLSMKLNELLDYYYGENGTEKFTEQQYYDNAKSNYVLVQHILYMFDDDSDVSDVSSEESLSEEQSKAKLKAEIDAKVKQIQDGEKTYEEFKADNDDSGFEYLVALENSPFVESFTKAAKEMEIGEIRVVETEYGYHMMRKIELTKEKYDEILSDKADNTNITETAESARSKLEQDALYEKLKDKIDKIVVNEAELGKFNIATAPVLQ